MKKTMIIAAALLASSVIWEAKGQIQLGDDRVVVANERRVNSDELEFSPVFYKDGIVFVTTRHESLIYDVKDKNANGVNIMSIFHSRRDEEGFLQEPVAFANELMERVHEGPLSFSSNASTIYFTRNEKEEKAPDGFKKLQVYSAKQGEGEIWEKITKLDFNNPNFNYLHPSVSVDEAVMYLASDVPGGYGGMDLYVVKKLGSDWGQLVNLGPTVNTPGNEVFPYVAADGTLYFSSDGHSGLGGLDIFFTNQFEGGEKWSYPINLGTPFSSPTDDFGFVVDMDNRNGYFSSDRKGGFGADDIYSFYIDSNLQPIAGGRSLDDLVVKDENGNPMEGVSISAVNFKEVSLAAGDDQVVKLLPGDGGVDNFILDVDSKGMGNTKTTNADGTADIAIGNGSYVVKIAKDGYLPQYVVVAPGTDIKGLDIQLKRAADCIAFSGQVLMQQFQTPVSGAEIHIVDVESGESVTVYTDAAGNYDYCLPCNRAFTVYALKNGTTSLPGVASTMNRPCVPSEKIVLDLFLGGTPIYAGMTIQLPNIYFNFDDATLRPDAYRDLDEVVGMLANYPGMKLELASHTDARGVAVYNLDLSQRRSTSVLKYLVSKGGDTNRLTPRGYGESQLRNRCEDDVACTEQEHQYNRRTEIKILEMGAPDATQPGSAQPIASTTDPADGIAENPNDFALAGQPDADKGGEEVAPIETPAPVEAPEVVRVKTTGAEKFEGGYAVIAGTFASKENAQRRLEVLNGLGYKQAAIVKQERNGLYAVWVNAFDKKTSAFNLVKKLATQQFRAYVLKR